MNICDNLPLYLYGEMNAGEKREFEKHLAECGYCRGLKETFGEVQDAKDLISAPLNVITGIFEKTSRKRMLFFMSMRMRKLAFAAAAFLLVGIGYFASNAYRSPAYDFSIYDGSNPSINEISNIDSDMDEFESLFII